MGNSSHRFAAMPANVHFDVWCGHAYYGRVRRQVAILTCLVLALTFLQAPFMHVHENQENEHHASTPFHTHFAHLETPSNTPVVRGLDPDDDAQDQPWFSAVIDHFELQLAAPINVAILGPAMVSEPFGDRVIESGHDPPLLSRSAPRAPPV